MQNPSIKYILKLSIPIVFANLAIPFVGIIDTGLMGNLGNLSYLWFGNWIRSLSFTSVVVVVSIFAYILYELAWERFMKKNK